MRTTLYKLIVIILSYDNNGILNRHHNSK